MSGYSPGDHLMSHDTLSNGLQAETDSRCPVIQWIPGLLKWLATRFIRWDLTTLS
jgi:hypothetical protein